MYRATVPGSNLRLTAHTCEWVEHRQWMYEVVRTALQRLGVRWKRAKQ
jgi:hypothetical protein